MSIFTSQQFPINNGLAPTLEQGPRCVPIKLVFTASVNQISDNFSVQSQDGTINNIQTIWFDSYFCSADVTLKLHETGQEIILPAFSQGYIPVLCGDNVTWTATLGNLVAAYANDFPRVYISFLNIPVDSFIEEKNPSNIIIFAQANGGNAAIGTGIGGQAGKIAFLTDVTITGDGATAASTINVTISGIYTTCVYTVFVPVKGNGSTDFRLVFDPPLMAVTPSTSISVSIPAMGAGNTAANSVCRGYYV